MKKLKKSLEKNWGKLLIGIIVAALALLLVFTEKKDKEIEGVSVNEWKEKVNEDNYTVTVLTLSYCSACKSFLPVIKEVNGEYDFDMYNFEIDTIGDSEYNALTTAFDMKNYEGSVPYTVIFKNGKFVADNTGYIDKAATIKFLKDNGVITE